MTFKAVSKVKGKGKGYQWLRLAGAWLGEREVLVAFCCRLWLGGGKEVPVASKKWSIHRWKGRDQWHSSWAKKNRNMTLKLRLEL